MGIRGLSTFFNNNPDLSKSHHLHDTPVIIDGNNLIHLLYFTNKVDFIYGGDYNKYASSVRKYFSSYLQCNIKPIVIFDGGYDKSDRKFRTILLRSKDRLTLTQQISKYGDCGGNVLPINAKGVFRDVLLEIGIPFAQCDFEADDQVTALANHYNCPVLSNDSDFYIFNIHNGFIRLSSIDTTVMETSNDEGSNYKFLKCDIYYIDKFLSYFPGINRNVLPLFGTLVGNDFVNTKDFAKFFSSIQFPKHKCKGLAKNPRQKKIVGILSWLAHCDLNEGIKQVLFYSKKDQREQLKSVIDGSINGYKIQNCNLTFVIDGKLDELEKILDAETNLKTPCGHTLPIPFVIAFHLGIIQPFFLNIINLHRTFLPAQVEDLSLDSSYVCSRYIRQVIYGILLQHSTDDLESHNEECLRGVEEYDRRKGRVQKEIVIPVYALSSEDSLPNLNDIYDMKKEDLKSIISAVLVSETSYLQGVPDNFQLLFGCMNYWMRNCSQKPSEELMYALILNIIYFHVILKKSHSVEANDNLKSGEKIDLLDLTSIINGISNNEAQFASQNIKKYLHKPALNRGNPLIISIIHSFSQLQTCMLYSLYLNILLNSPFKSPKLHEMFAGTLLYNLTKDLLSRPFPELFISELLGRQSKLNTLFTVIKTKIFESVPPDTFLRIDRSQLQRSKGKKSKNKSSKHQVPEYDITDQKEESNSSETKFDLEEDFSEVFI